MTTRSVLIICAVWVLVTFTLNWWVMQALARMPNWEAQKMVSKDRIALLDVAIAGYEPSPVERARQRAAMQIGESKLAHVLTIAVDAESYVQGLAASADMAGRQVSKRAWISWAVVAFIPVVAFVPVASRARLLAAKPQRAASPNGGPAERLGNSGAGGGPPSVS